MKCIVKLHNMLCDLNYVNICMMVSLHVLYVYCVKWHNAFHMHWDSLEIR